jgi:hypothetical protein
MSLPPSRGTFAAPTTEEATIWVVLTARPDHGYREQDGGRASLAGKRVDRGSGCCADRASSRSASPRARFLRSAPHARQLDPGGGLEVLELTARYEPGIAARRSPPTIESAYRPATRTHDLPAEDC